ncbi:Hint domain-containing protein [Rhodophyticola sp. CCM32]|uniref:Hint domain-containing protein n=1 Tax=Rhodophyticola sp. CCM32 TaxID=2916397 RepID=UPI00143CEE10|nr:Hint domain-containing protein [Rhodophyticola sp. CCM32]
MPSGYLVNLGTNNSLDALDSISGAYTSFTTATNIGVGEWMWSGTDDGDTYTNQQESGTFYEATDGNVYFVPDEGEISALTEASVISAPAFVQDDGVVEGSDGDDLIDASYTDADGTQAGSTIDTIKAGDGDDTVYARGRPDTVYGDGGADNLRGGGGADLIYGGSDGVPAATSEALVWDDITADEADISAGFTYSTGKIDVTLSFADDGDNDPEFEIESTSDIYTASGEPFGENSSLRLAGDGSGATSTTVIDFSADDRGYTGEVENVQFRINDIDSGSGQHQDEVTVNAFDVDGNPVTVSFTPGGGDTVLGNTITADNSSDSADDLEGSVLIEIAGPVSQIEIIYVNQGDDNQAIWVSDIHFDSIPSVDGDDTIIGGGGSDTLFGEDGDDRISGGNQGDSIDGGAGDDTMLGGRGDDTLLGGEGDDSLEGNRDDDLLQGGAGDDTIIVAEGDTATGGDGDDLFVLTDLGEGGAQDITITGGEGDETGGDTLDLNEVATLNSVVITNSDDASGGLEGYATLLDGSTIFFDEIENIICFTPGTRILTPAGDRAIETLSIGDPVVTRDDGVQPIRWIGSRMVPGIGKFAPILIKPGGVPGMNRPLLVSPQHRMLIEGYQAEMTFGEEEILVAARHLIDGQKVMQKNCGFVTYIHMMFDRHQIVYAEGAATESFHLGDQGLDALSAKSRDDLFRNFPHLRADPNIYGPTARRCARAHEAQLLLA